MACLARDETAVKEVAKKFPKAADQIPQLKKWLQAQVDAGKE